MFAKNIWELKLPFSINYQGRQITIPPDGQLHFIPDDADVDPSGVKGYLQLYRANPNPPIYQSNLREIDLSKLNIYHPEKYEEYYENYEEEKLKRKAVIEESIKDTIERASKNKREKATQVSENINQTDNQGTQREIQNSADEELIQESSEVNSLEDLLSPIQDIPKESSVEKIVKPLAGKRIPKNVANRGIKSRIKKKLRSKDSASDVPLEKK